MNSRLILVLSLVAIALAGCRTGGGEGRVEQDTAQNHTLTLPKPPAMMTGDSLRIDYMAAYYWDGMDVADTTWATDTAALEQAVADWTALARLLPPHRAAELTADALRRTGCTPALQRLMYEVAVHYFCHPNSPYRDERVCLALHGAAYNITSNAVCPGNILTPMGRTLAWSHRDPKTYIPLGRYGTPQEYGRLAVFLCSQANTYISGQTILLDGAMTRAY